MKKIDISIIIPVYNVEAYLRDCLDSVVEQDCENFEVICVNDGSTDNSPSILDEYEKKYNSVYVYTKKNGGLSSARNYGMQKATGKYVFFLDSDDMLADKHCLSFMVERMSEHSLDVLYFDGNSFYEDEVIHQINTNFYETAYKREKSYGLYQCGRELFTEFVRNGDYYVQSSLHCLRKDFIDRNQLSFKEGLLYEDNLFMFMSMMLAQKVMHQNRTVLSRRIRAGSIMQSHPKFHNFYSLYYTYQKIVEFCSDRIPKEYADKEITIVLNSLRNNTISMYLRLADKEKDQIFKLPQYEQFLIKAVFFPDVRVIGDAHFFPYHLFHSGDRIVIYGAGNIGKKFYHRAIKENVVDIVGIVDAKALEMETDDVPVLPVPMIKQMDFDYLLIAVENSDVVWEIKNNLLKMNIPEYKIKWDGDVYFRDNYYRKSYEYQKFTKRLMQSDRKRFFLFMLPEHGNLGDYAIAIAEKQFFDDYFPEYELISVTTNEWLELKTYFVGSIKKTDVLFITGGGFVGDMWKSFCACKDILQSFPQNRKILLPNTLTYHDLQNEDAVRNDLEQIFSDGHTYVFFRERNSLKVCTDLGWGDRCFCFPDMVLYLKFKETEEKRNGKVLLCFRVDTEKIFQEVDSIKNIIMRNQIQYDELDTHRYKYIPEPEGDLYVRGLLEKFQKYDLVITDRLHGMLFAYVSGTPCIAFDNSTHKVSGVYEWIKGVHEVSFLEKYDEDKMDGLVTDYRRKGTPCYQNSDLSRQFSLMKEKIKELITED